MKEQQTRQGKIVSQIISLIFYLNNNKRRFEFKYSGYVMTLSKYNFSLKTYELVFEINVTRHSYSYVNKGLGKILSILKNETEEEC